MQTRSKATYIFSMSADCWCEPGAMNLGSLMTKSNQILPKVYRVVNKHTHHTSLHRVFIRRSALYFSNLTVRSYNSAGVTISIMEFLREYSRELGAWSSSQHNFNCLETSMAQLHTTFFLLFDPFHNLFSCLAFLPPFLIYLLPSFCCERTLSRYLAK